MFESFPFDRHRAEYDEISRQCGGTSIGTLRRIYGLRFAWTVNSNVQLADAFAIIDAVSLDQLVKHHNDGSLPARIAQASK